MLVNGKFFGGEGFCGFGGEFFWFVFFFWYFELGVFMMDSGGVCCVCSFYGGSGQGIEDI